jgi:hypothetical protein
MWQILPLK